MDKLPSEGEETDYNNLHFKVAQVNRNRIERIILTIHEISEASEAEAHDTTT